MRIVSRFLWAVAIAIGVDTTASAQSAGVPNTKIPAYENWIRYDCDLNRPDDLVQAKKNFQAIVNTATASCLSGEDTRLASLADIEGATFLDKTGELVIWGPKMNDANFMPPLLWDDFVVALRIVSSGDNPSVSIGTYHGRKPTKQDMEEARRTGVIPVEYSPEMLELTHAGVVFFEADRWLKSLAIGIDNFTGRSVRCPVRGYRSTTERVQVTTRATGYQPYGRNWFMPTEPHVAIDNYAMRFGTYKMQVKNELYTSDPAPKDFAEQIENNFDEYCRYYPVFRELVRLFKLVQVARWYNDSRFPSQPILDNYHPLPIKTMDSTRQKEARTADHRVGNYVYSYSLIGGVVFSSPNHYVPADAVRAQNLQYGAPSTWSAPANARPPAPIQYRSIVGPVPTPALVTPLIEARPTPTTMVWTVQSRGAAPATLVAVIQIPKGPDMPILAGPPLSPLVAPAPSQDRGPLATPVAPSVPMVQGPTAKTERIAELEDFIRHHPKDPRSADAFREVVKMATDSSDGDGVWRLANLADIDGAILTDTTGELIVSGPKCKDGNVLPPLLWDDFVVSLRIAESGGVPAIVHKLPPSSGDVSRDVRKGIPIEYQPQFLGETHVGRVVYESDRWLMCLAFGIDPVVGTAIRSPVAGYRSLIPTSENQPLDPALAARVFELRLAPDPSRLVIDKHAMTISSYRLRVKDAQDSSHPSTRGFAEHVTEQFDNYAEHYPVLQEFRRLSKLVQVARWYIASDFPTQSILAKHKPLRFQPRTTMMMVRPANRTTTSLMEERQGAPAAVLDRPNLALLRSLVPPAASGDFLAEVLEARPAAGASIWTVETGDRTRVAVAVTVRPTVRSLFAED